MSETRGSLSFVFKSNEHIDRAALKQGDLLRRTKRLTAALAEAHQHYAESQSYTHFMVLTQSCDLVQRGTRGIKSYYITICAVRPLGEYLKKKFATNFHNTGAPVRVGRLTHFEAAKQLIERLVHNTENDVFFIGQDSADSVEEPLCAFLQLSVPLKASHYDACLAAKVAEMDDIFSAKAGWLKGNLYSRVATRDIEEVHGRTEAQNYITELFNGILGENTIWLSDKHAAEFEKRVKKAEQDKGSKINKQEAQSLAKEFPQPIDELAEAISRLLKTNKIVSDPKTLIEVQNLIQNNVKIGRLVS